MKNATKKSIMEKANKKFRAEVFRCVFICCLFLVVAVLMTNLSGTCAKYCYFSWQCHDAEEQGNRVKNTGFNKEENWLESDHAYFNRANSEKKEFISNNSLAKFFSENFSDTYLKKTLRIVIFAIIWIITIIAYVKTYIRFKRSIRHLAFELVKKVKLEKRLSIQ